MRSVKKQGVSEQTSSYRKGLVLGLTMAEIVVLIIFVLLLAFAALLNAEKEKTNQMSAALESTKAALVDANQKAEALIELSSEFSNIAKVIGDKDVDKFVRELLEAKISQQKLNEINQLLKKTKKEKEQYEKILREAGLKASPDSIVQALEEAKSLSEAFEHINDKTSTEVAKDYIELITENNRLEGQLANITRKLKQIGKGTEMPACWAKPDGSVEYIYDIALASEGLILRSTKLPHREEGKKILPISNVIENETVSNRKFLSMTKNLFKWSVEKKCRFFVRVFDATKAEEKKLYKKRLQTVEGHFYKKVMSGEF